MAVDPLSLAAGASQLASALPSSSAQSSAAGRSESGDISSGQSFTFGDFNIAGGGRDGAALEAARASVATNGTAAASPTLAGLSMTQVLIILAVAGGAYWLIRSSKKR